MARTSRYLGPALEAHLANPNLTLTEIAGQIGCSVSNLSSLNKKHEIGIPRDYSDAGIRKGQRNLIATLRRSPRKGVVAKALRRTDLTPEEKAIFEDNLPAFAEQLEGQLGL